MTSSLRDSIPLPTLPVPTLFERMLREVLDVTDERSGARVHSAFNEWLDGAGCVCEKAKNLDLDGQVSTAKTRAEIAASVPATFRRTDQDLRTLQDAAGSGPLPAARIRDVAEQVVACSIAAFTPRQVLQALTRHTTQARSTIARSERPGDHDRWQ
jgi:hypothetical protein